MQGGLNINSYEYQSPMEKHLSKILTETSEKELEIQKLKSEIDSMRPPEDNPSDTIAITCGRCHQGNHTKRRCVDPPCTTSISCGKIRFHKSELKELELKKAQLKKLIRDKSSLESECKKVRDTITATVKSFPQAVKTALINSNKKEYLAIHDGKFVPLTTKINRDISILQKYYNGKIPDDIESESSMFPAIIQEASKQFRLNSLTVEQKLEEHLSSVHRKITCTSTLTPSDQYIVLDSPPVTNQTFSVQSSNVNDESPAPLYQSPIHSPPSKMLKSNPTRTMSIGDDSPLDNIVTTFEKLTTPTKSVRDCKRQQTTSQEGACRNKPIMHPANSYPFEGASSSSKFAQGTGGGPNYRKDQATSTCISTEIKHEDDSLVHNARTIATTTPSQVSITDNFSHHQQPYPAIMCGFYPPHHMSFHNIPHTPIIFQRQITLQLVQCPITAITSTLVFYSHSSTSLM